MNGGGDASPHFGNFDDGHLPHTFKLFANPDYFPASTRKTCINPAFAWNHGDIQPEIAQTWRRS